MELAFFLGGGGGRTGGWTPGEKGVGNVQEAGKREWEWEWEWEWECFPSVAGSEINRKILFNSP